MYEVYMNARNIKYFFIFVCVILEADIIYVRKWRVCGTKNVYGQARPIETKRRKQAMGRMILHALARNISEKREAKKRAKRLAKMRMEEVELSNRMIDFSGYVSHDHCS